MGRAQRLQSSFGVDKTTEKENASPPRARLELYSGNHKHSTA